LLKLLVTKGRALGAEIHVEDELEIGRTAEGKGQLAGDVEISRRHARISRTDDGSYLVEDLGSTNGTQLNGVPVQSPQSLAPGDTLEMGGTMLLVEHIPTGPHPVQPDTPTPQPAAVARVEAPAPTEDQPAAAAPVRIALQIEIDVEASSATVRLDDGPEGTVELEHRDGVWRFATGA